jgi:hypothetical protein
MLLAAVRLPGAVSALTPIVSAVSPADAVLPAVVGLMASYNQVFGVSDPTSTQTVWSAQYAGVRPERARLSTLPYTWLVGAGGIVLTAVLYLP